MEHISFVSETTTLRGRVFYPQHGAASLLPALLVVHGWRSDIEKYYERAQELANIGFAVLVFGLRGHGESDGASETFSTHTRRDHIHDVVAAYNFLAGLPTVDALRIHAFGTSYGGYLLAAASDTLHFSSLALRAPAIYPDETLDESAVKTIELGADMLREYRNTISASRPTVAFAGIAKLGEAQDLLIVGAGLDTTIPETVISAYEHAAQDVGTKTVMRIKGADHRFSNPKDYDFFFASLCGWYASLLRRQTYKT